MNGLLEGKSIATLELVKGRRLFSTVVPRSDKPPIFDGITIRNIHGTAAKQAMVLLGLEDSHIKNLKLENIEIKAGMPDVVKYVL